MGRHALRLMDLADEEKKGFLLSSHTSCTWEQGLDPSAYSSDHVLRNAFPACLWDSSMGAFGGSLSFRLLPVQNCKISQR